MSEYRTGWMQGRSVPVDKRDASFGVVPMRTGEAGGRAFLLVLHRKGHWGFPKGHPDDGETPVESATRELREETGLADVKLLDAPPFHERYLFVNKKGLVVDKSVTYFLGEVQSGEVILQPDEVMDYAWGDAKLTRRRLSFPEGKAMLDEVLAYLGEEARDGTA